MEVLSSIFYVKELSVHEPVVRAVVKVAKVTDALVVVSATGEDWEQAVKNKTTATNTEAGVLINFFIIKIFKWMNLFILCNQQQINCKHIFKKFYSFNFTAKKKKAITTFSLQLFTSRPFRKNS